MARASDAKTSTSRNRPRAAPERAEVPSPEQRRRMIAEAAYYRAQARGFRDGDPVQDWLEAEAEIDAALGGRPAFERAYDRLRAEVQRGLSALRGSIDAQAIQDVVDRAAGRARKAGEFAAETINTAAERLRREIAEATAAMGPRWEAFSERTASVFAVWRDRGSAFLARAAIGVADWLEQTGRRFERSGLRAGDVATPGVYECTQCREPLRLEAAGSLPPCPRCAHTDYRRVS